jgi:hypothetical protein
VVDRVHRIVLDVLREVGRGQCWEVDRGSWHDDGRVWRRVARRGGMPRLSEFRNYLEARLII